MNRLFELSTPIAFAHRGSSAHAPENTIAAFCLALEQGADAVELDVKLSRDGKIMVFHDLTLDRVTGVKGRFCERTFADLRSLDAGEWFSTRFKGERIPMLSEVFEAVGKNMVINIELTNYDTPGDALPEEVAKLVKEHNVEDRVIFSSFDPRNLVKIRQRLPESQTALLAHQGWRGAISRSLAWRWVSPRMLHPYCSDVDASFVRRVHRLGARMHVWTVNDPAEMTRLANLGVDGLFTDDPLLFQKTLAGRKA